MKELVQKGMLLSEEQMGPALLTSGKDRNVHLLEDSLKCLLIRIPQEMKKRYW
jgi:hypothetical protein